MINWTRFKAGCSVHHSRWHPTHSFSIPQTSCPLYIHLHGSPTLHLSVFTISPRGAYERKFFCARKNAKRIIYEHIVYKLLKFHIYTKKVSKWKIFNLRIFVDFDLHKDLKDPIRCAIYNLAMEKLLCRLGLLGTLWVVRWSCNCFLHQNRRPGFLPLERGILLHGQLLQESRQIRSRGFARRIYEIKTTTPLEINCLFFVN